MSYIQRIEPRWVEIVDVETALFFGLSQFRHPPDGREEAEAGGSAWVGTRDMNFNPFDLPAAHIFKVSGGKMHEIQAAGFSSPYDSKTGWSNK
ncbi:MAG: hypothetical protein ABI824_02060 [Acidobacteriota bacterium]